MPTAGARGRRHQQQSRTFAADSESIPVCWRHLPAAEGSGGGASEVKKRERALGQLQATAGEQVPIVSLLNHARYDRGAQRR